MKDNFAGIIDQLEQRKAAIDVALAALRAVGPPVTALPSKTAVAPEASTGKRRRFSAASRERMALAQKARWAKVRGDVAPSAPEPSPKSAKPKPKSPNPSSRISPEGLKRIIAATKKRWRLKREAAKAASAPAVAQAAG